MIRYSVSSATPSTPPVPYVRVNGQPRSNRSAWGDVEYLWFRAPLQVVFLAWVVYFGIVRSDGPKSVD